jgi:hypothetical protein
VDAVMSGMCGLGRQKKPRIALHNTRGTEAEKPARPGLPGPCKN